MIGRENQKFINVLLLENEISGEKLKLLISNFDGSLRGSYVNFSPQNAA